MDFIRAEKAQKKYDPNTRHCLYGLDADLVESACYGNVTPNVLFLQMMLGLATHEPHFSLLREEVRFGSKKDVSFLHLFYVTFQLLCYAGPVCGYSLRAAFL